MSEAPKVEGELFSDDWEVNEEEITVMEKLVLQRIKEEEFEEIWQISIRNEQDFKQKEAKEIVLNEKDSKKNLKKALRRP